MSSTDSLLARYSAEIEEKSQFLNGIVEDAEKNGRDLTSQEVELIGRTRDRVSDLQAQIEPVQQAAQIAIESRNRTAEITEQFRAARGEQTKPLEYRSAGEYVLDRWRAGLGEGDAVKRQDLFHRAAAHQTTTDNPGLLPETIIGPVINFIDASRPVTSFLGPRNLPSNSFSRPRVTQHTNVGPQVGEKTELVSRKMLITKVPITPTTYGGYVNVSRQDIDWSQPQIMDIVIQDLAAVYAQETEKALCLAIDTATTAGPVIPTGTPTPAAVNAAIWTAVGSVYAVTKGAGQVFIAASPDALGLLGPGFAPINPTNAYSPGFSAANYSTGIAGSISGVPVVVSAGFTAANVMIVTSTAAVEVYEDRIGALSVVEPSVLGVQVAYAGYFASLMVDATAIIQITKTP